MIPKRFRSITLIAYGNVVEWYDFSLFGYFAVTLSHTFFPAMSAVNGLMATFLTFFIGLLARPLGGYLFGRIADLNCRTKSLRASIYLMVVPTTIMGLLPSYQTIGMLAPIMLVMMRFLQGLCAGGQYSSAIVLSYEKADYQRRALHCSVNHVTSMLGYGLAIIVSLFFIYWSSPQWNFSAWRAPFLLSPFIVLVYYLLLHRWKDDADHKPKHQSVLVSPSLSDVSFFRFMIDYRRGVMMATLLASCGGVFYFTLFVYVISFLIDQGHFSTVYAFVVSGISMAFSCFVVVSCALLVDRWGEERLIQVSVTLILLGSLLFIPSVAYSSAQLAAVVVIMVALNSLFIASSVVVYPRLFPESARVRGVSLGYNFGSGLFGGAAPMMATWLVHKHGPSGITELLIVFCLVAIVTLQLIFRHDKHDCLLQHRIE